MAGEWLKMECATPEKTEVFNIAVKMGWSDPDLVVGKLFKIWRWFDEHTTDGNARGVTLALLDNITGVSGFAQAMSEVGWLTVTDDGVMLPKFDLHNGATAKKRSQTAKRVAKHKSNSNSNAQDNAEGNANSVSGELPRIRIREELDKNNIKEKINKKESPGRNTRLPENFELSQSSIAHAQERGIDIATELQAFKDYHAAKGSTMRDWQAAWRTWCGNAVKFGKSNARASPQPVNKQEALEQRNAEAGRRWLEKQGIET